MAEPFLHSPRGTVAVRDTIVFVLLAAQVTSASGAPAACDEDKEQVLGVGVIRLAGL